jgi:hypothetical protein
VDTNRANRLALGAEVRALVGAHRVTAKQVQDATRISSSSWSNYFIQCTRDAPMGAIIAVAGFFGLESSELLRRAEARLKDPSLSEYLLRQTTPEKQAAARRMHEELMAKRRKAAPPNG